MSIVIDYNTNANATQRIWRKKTVRSRIKAEMRKRGWSELELAKRSGVPQPTINRILSGAHGDPRTVTIQKLAAAFGITEAVLRGISAEPPPRVNNDELPQFRIPIELAREVIKALPIRQDDKVKAMHILENAKHGTKLATLFVR